MSDPKKWIGVAVGALLVIGLAFVVGRVTAPDGEAAHAHGQGQGGEQTWTCSMHPQVRRSEPGSCPICGMELIPVTDDAPGPNEVVLSERAAALAEVRTSPVRRLRATGATLRLLGRVGYDESTHQTVTAWVGGRLDRLHVRTTGERVRRGQVVASVYSPEVYAAEQDLITAKRQLTRLAGASEIARSAATASLEAARQRLRLLGIPDREIEQVEGRTSPRRQVAVRSPFGGTVIERLATEGTYVQTGAPLYRLADLTRLWVLLDAFEPDLPHLAVGQTVELEVEALPGETLEGRVAFVDPVIDPRRRTAQVRIEISDPERRLRPGTFVEAVVRGDPESSAQPLVVPASAPLFTGQRSVVYVEVPGAARPTYQARTVRLGARVGDVFPVVTGLEEGERVVTQGAFALDADLQIRGGHSMMARPDDSTPPAPRLEVDDAFLAGLRPVVEGYVALGRALAEDDLAAATAAARATSEAARAFDPDAPAPAATHWDALGPRVRREAERVAAADSLQAARAPFEPLGAAVASAVESFGNPLEVPLRLAHCPMAFDNRGARWLQTGEAVDNAYFGAAMRTCGSVEATVEPGERLDLEQVAP